MEETVHCRACGAAVRAELAFCTSCGTTVVDGSRANTAPPSPSTIGSCPACGTPAATSDAFCAACGKNLSTQTPVTTPSATPAAAAPGTSQAASSTPAQDEPSWLRRHPVLAIAGAIIIVLAVIYGVTSCSGGGSQDDSQSTTPTETGPTATALPQEVTNLTANANGSRLLLSFVGSAADRRSIMDYVAEYRMVDDSAWTVVDDRQTQATSIMVSGLKPGEMYSFRVAGVNSMGRGPWAELQAEAPAARCSNKTLGELYGDEVDAWWRVSSVQSAWLDETISGSVLQRRLKKRLATYAATYKALTKACAAPRADQSPLLEAEAAAYAADVAYARFLLRAAAGNVGSEAKYARLRNNRYKATETASAAWEAFAVENGITLSPPTPIDESKETD